MNVSDNNFAAPLPSLSTTPPGETQIQDDGSRYGPFDQEAEDIHARLHAAIIQRDKGKIGPLARELNKYWALALARQYREGFHRVNKMMLAAAQTAYLFAQESNTQDPLYHWGELWDYLGETGDAMERMHLDWIAAKGVALVESRQLPHGKTIITQLWDSGSVAYKQLLEQLAKTETTKQQEIPTILNDHLRQLLAHNLIDQPDHETFTLTGQGEMVARKMVANSEEHPKLNVFRDIIAKNQRIPFMEPSMTEQKHIIIPDMNRLPADSVVKNSKFTSLSDSARKHLASQKDRVTDLRAA